MTAESRACGEMVWLAGVEGRGRVVGLFGKWEKVVLVDELMNGWRFVAKSELPTESLASVSFCCPVHWKSQSP